MSARRKALFIAEGVTLAHVGRAITLARSVHARGDEVVLACDARYARFTQDLPFHVRPIRSIAPDAFAAALTHGRPVYSSHTLASYAQDDLALLSDVRPDVVVGDFRLSLSVSARVARVPYVNVTNAYWSPYARPRFRMPDIALARRIPSAVANPLFRAVRPIAFAVHALPLNRVRRRYGLVPLPLDVRHAYCDGDLTLYADLPELIPLHAAPASHRHIGPVGWSPPVTPPPWWDSVLRGPAPIYLSLGSSGAAHRLPAVLEALLPLRHPIVVATAGHRAAIGMHEDVHVADFLPGDVIAKHARLVVCNGGSPATMQALAHGVPVLGMAGNLDQYLNMAYIERFGAGLMLSAQRSTALELRSAADRLVHDADVRARAQALAVLCAAVRTDTAFPAALATLVEGRPQAATNAVC
jgi:UDP:flavonoid glycosyltransferase YjiC (YdhE family)